MPQPPSHLTTPLRWISRCIDTECGRVVATAVKCWNYLLWFGRVAVGRALKVKQTACQVQAVTSLRDKSSRQVSLAKNHLQSDITTLAYYHRVGKRSWNTGLSDHTAVYLSPVPCSHCHPVHQSVAASLWWNVSKGPEARRTVNLLKDYRSRLIEGKNPINIFILTWTQFHSDHNYITSKGS